ncbi:MAG: sodium:solute symporter family protein [Saprospiraceae bacterium]|nr:sodium:solute symporter family protein [Saprospiraceae bacterium]
MTNNQILLVFILIYMIVTVLIGWWASRFVKNTSDFVIAGRRMPMSVVAAGLFATWFGSETVMGASTAFLNEGLMGIIEDPFGAALCLIFIGVFMAKPLYRLNLFTFSDYFRRRYSHRAETLSAIMMIPSYWGWIAAQLIALATILNVLTQIPIFTGVLICALMVMFYTYIGGMWAVSVTDFVQTVMIIGGMLFVMINSINMVGGLDVLMNHAYQEPEKFKILPEPDFKSIVAYFAAWITVGLGSVPQQDVFQRVMSAKSEKAAIWGAYVSGLMYLTVGLMPIVIVYCGKIMYPELLKGGDEARQMIIPYMVMQHSGLGMQILFFGALMSAIMSTASGAILAPSTVIGENIIKPLYPKLTDKQLLFVMRLGVVFITLVSVFFTTLDQSIYELVRQSSELSLVSLFVPLIAGLYWKKSSAWGAMAAMVIGLVVWLITTYLKTEYPAIIYGLLASIAGMVVFSLFEHQKKIAENTEG